MEESGRAKRRSNSDICCCVVGWVGWVQLELYERNVAGVRGYYVAYWVQDVNTEVTGVRKTTTDVQRF